jgi:hypothetical protein
MMDATGGSKLAGPVPRLIKLFFLLLLLLLRTTPFN